MGNLIVVCAEHPLVATAVALFIAGLVLWIGQVIVVVSANSAKARIEEARSKIDVETK